MKIKIIQFNLFNTPATDTDPFDLTTSIISTRVYVLLLGLSMTILIIFIGLQIQIHTVTIHNPSQTIYENLYSNYPTTLQCPRSQIAIPYRSFLSFSPVYHPVCSSLYLSADWINSIEGTINLDFAYNYTDFHMVGQGFFTAVASLCSLSQSIVSDRVYFFNQSTLITDDLLPATELMVRAGIIFDQFETTTIAEFKRTLLLTRFFTQAMFSTSRGNADLYTDQLIDNITQVIFN